MTYTVAELERMLGDAKRLEVEQKGKCSNCRGKGFVCDTTYDRTGVDYQCSDCFGTGFDAEQVRAIIDNAFSMFRRWHGLEARSHD